MPDSVYDLPVLYFYSEIRDISSATKMFVRFDQKAGRIAGETGFEGLRLDFNSGLRLRVPEGNWHITICDFDSEKVFFDDDVSEKILVSMEKYFIRWKVDAFFEGELVFSHVLNLEGQTIFIEILQKILGETVLLLPYIQAFQDRHRCHVALKVWDMFHPMVREYYPALELCDRHPEETYASFYLGAYQDDVFMACDIGRALPMEHIPRLILDMPGIPIRGIWSPVLPRQIPGPYVCIAVQGSSARKAWLHPTGWADVVAYLKSLGYRVLCIDKERESHTDGYRVAMPEAAEDCTGNFPLMDRLNLLAYAEFFIGVSSGLSWMANAAGCPVVLISGITMPYVEFDTPYRVMNRLVCHGCYNDLDVDGHELFCPYYHGTDRECECSRKISPRQVMEAIDRLREDEHRKRHDAGHRTGI